MILLDSNVLIDLIEGVGRWSEWARRSLAARPARSDAIVNAVVLAETARHFGSAGDQQDYLASLEIDVRSIDRRAAWRAGCAHQAYRRAGGERIAILADFLIGGHAAGLGAALLTRDRQRFAAYFPELNLITPEIRP